MSPYNGMDRIEFRAYALLFWKLGFLDEASFDALMALFDSFGGEPHRVVADRLEAELRQ
jgi:hypothetical protein